MPPRRNRYDDFESDTYFQIYEQLATPRKGRRERVRRGLTGFQDHRDFFRDLSFPYDFDEQRNQRFWADYLFYFVSGKARTRRRLNDPRHPFWRKYHMDPSKFDWHGWREAMGYPHGNRE